jgi:putative nucleotidyltransferase with HDIG domain
MVNDYLKSTPNGLSKLNCFVFGVSNILLQARLYPEGNHFVKKLYDDFHVNLKRIQEGKKKIIFRVIEGSIYYMNFRMDINQRHDKRLNIFREVIRKMNISEIEITMDINKDEIKAFIDICIAVLKNDTSADLSRMWNKIRNIKIRNGDKINKGVVVSLTSDRSLMPKLNSGFAEGNGIGGEIGEVLTRLKKLESSQTRRAGNRILELVMGQNQNYYAILFLKSLKSYDVYTFNHSVNVAVISTALASRLGYSDNEISAIGLAGLMHDVGKLHVPFEILHKAGRLTPTEWQYVKRHPVDGAKILREEGSSSSVERVAFEHHIGYNMRGYPNVRKNQKVLDASYIVQIADTYDALTTKRTYRKQLNPFEAVIFMQQMRGKEYHPHFIDIFMTVLGNLPIGSLVQLDSEETAIVVDTDDGMGNLPSVRVIRDSNGFAVGSNIIVDLNEKDTKTGKYLKSIKNVLDTPIRDVDIGHYTIGRT